MALGGSMFVLLHSLDMVAGWLATPVFGGSAIACLGNFDDWTNQMDSTGPEETPDYNGGSETCARCWNSGAMEGRLAICRIAQFQCLRRGPTASIMSPYTPQ